MFWSTRNSKLVARGLLILPPWDVGLNAATILSWSWKFDSARSKANVNMETISAESQWLMLKARKRVIWVTCLLNEGICGLSWVNTRSIVICLNWRLKSIWLDFSRCCCVFGMDLCYCRHRIARILMQLGSTTPKVTCIQWIRIV